MPHYLTILFTVLVVQVLGLPSEERELVHQCISTPLGDLCVDVTSNDCLELTGKVTLNDNRSIWGPRQISIPRAVSAVQERAQKQNQENITICDAVNPNLNPGFPMPNCSICTEISKLKIVGGELNFCGKFFFNCTLPVGNLKRELEIPCVNISGCSSFGCQNGCNGGTCTPLGICQCAPNTYGVDCSVNVETNCVQTLEGIICWETKLLDCSTVQVSILRNNEPVNVYSAKILPGNSVPLAPCFSIGNSDSCKMCLVLEDFNIIGSNLTGCEKIHLNCSGIDVNTYDIGCNTLAINDKICTGTTTGLYNYSTNDEMDTEMSTSKIVLLGMVGLLVVVILGMVGYCGYYKWSEWRLGKENQKQETEFLTTAYGDDDDNDEGRNSENGSSINGDKNDV